MNPSEIYRLVAVSYLNTKPFLYGIFQHEIAQQLRISLDIPSVCAAKLQSGEADLGLIPVAAIPHLSSPHIISDFCIGAVGQVATVCIYSNVPLSDIKTLYLDFHSRTSVALTKLLIKDFWHIQPTLKADSEGNEGAKHIGGTTAALVIGDKAIGLEQRFKYTYDLAEAWMQYTGLPFVFAAWVSNRPLDPEFIRKFNVALQIGLDHIPELTALMPDSIAKNAHFNLEKYFSENISYTLDDRKKRALDLFLNAISPNLKLEYLTA